ncbi:protein phosphatase methylesterase 1 [Onthophagus taurus]|uniref:protein phosphatase methylesterase 1 n=1 Tax=Onthophagus taurus TaxID=166361 RepID=UPI000C20C0A6|nr:protein phosphatase methylesterase 1 [Onthophagus taurus]
MSSLRKNLLSKGSKRFTSGAIKDFSPTKWEKYFDSKRDVKIGESIFNVYLKGNSGPVVAMLHGGGYSALTWALFTEEITRKVECQVLAIDLRGHGLTNTEDDMNLSLEILASDVDEIIKTIFTENIPPVVLIGHSMGGAIAVESAYLIQTAVALCVIDVVEGSAMESLSAMQSILRGRPNSFKTIDQAIQWSFRSGQTHNLEAARISMPGQIKNSKTGLLATQEIDLEESSTEPRQYKLVHQRSADCIAEVDEDSRSEDSPGESSSQEVEKDVSTTEFVKPSDANSYTWRIDLSKTESFWSGWFKGLSQKFLNIAMPKVLLLANIYGLDTTLTIGQMQGKFQLQVLAKSGHAIHEDQPGNVADIVAGFLVKQKLAVAKEGFVPSLPAC